MLDILVFTPVYRLEPETIESIFALEWDGPISYLFQRDNPLSPDEIEDDRVRGVRNHLHQYKRGRDMFLKGQYDAMLVIESDIIAPPDTLQRLVALDADVAYGVYMFRDKDTGTVVNLLHRHNPSNGRRAANVGQSLSLVDAWPPQEPGPMDVSGAGLGCTLIKRRVLKEIDFRTLETLPPRVHCDTWWTTDVWRAGFEMRADTRVICGHKTPQGEVLWPPS